jgi:poly(A) polymerase
VTPTDDASVQRRELYRLGRELYRDLALLSWADALREGRGEDAARYHALVAAAEAWQPVFLPVKGADVLDLGIERGPEVGRLLMELEEWWVNGDFRAGRKECLAKLKELAGR